MLFISGSKSPPVRPLYLLEHSGWTDDENEALEDEIDPRLVVRDFWRIRDHCGKKIDLEELVTMHAAAF